MRQRIMVVTEGEAANLVRTLKAPGHYVETVTPIEKDSEEQYPSGFDVAIYCGGTKEPRKVGETRLGGTYVMAVNGINDPKFILRMINRRFQL